jgi:hypothetical protein
MGEIDCRAQGTIEEKIQLICPDFDLDCFHVQAPNNCYRGGWRWVVGSYYYLEPSVGICPCIKD